MSKIEVLIKNKEVRKSLNKKVYRLVGWDVVAVLKERGELESMSPAQICDVIEYVVTI